MTGGAWGTCGARTVQGVLRVGSIFVPLQGSWLAHWAGLKPSCDRGATAAGYYWMVVELGSLLELMHGALHRWETFQAVCHEWRHTGRSREAFDRVWEGRGSRSMLRGPVAEAPEVVEEAVRVWVAGLDRLRSEVVVSDRRAGSVTVVDGDRWWMFDPERGVLRHDGGDDTSVGTYDVETFLDPSVRGVGL